MKLLFSILPCLALCIFSLEGLRPSRTVTKDEALYLPNINAVKVLSFGYKKPLSHILWFKTLNYFGKHYSDDKDYHLLKHHCSLIQELNPSFLEVAEFCSLMLAWELKQPKDAIEILDEAIRHHDTNPERWRLYYLRGIDKAYFLKDATSAANDFEEGSKLDNAPTFMKELAIKTKERAGVDIIDFLKRAVHSAKDRREREVLLKELNKYTGKEQ